MIRVLEKLQLYKIKKVIFSLKFLNRDISPNIPSPRTKFWILILYIVMEGTVSQNFDVCPSFRFMESRK